MAAPLQALLHHRRQLFIERFAPQRGAEDENAEWAQSFGRHSDLAV
jgi:hypothetical protein